MATTSISLTIYDDFLIPRTVVASNIVVDIDATYIYIDGVGDVFGASNLGPGAGVFAQKNAGILEFKSLVAGSYIGITSNNTTITFNSTSIGINGTNLGGDTNAVFVQNNAGTLEFRTVIAGTNVNIAQTDTTLVINISADVDVSATNLGAGAGVFATDIGNSLYFRSLVGGSYLSITSDSTTITLNSTGTVLGGANLGGDTNAVFVQNNAGTLEFRTIIAGTNVNIAQTDTTLVVNISADVDVSATNLGAGAGVFATDVGNSLYFRSLVGGSYVSITSDSTTITLNASNVVTSATGMPFNTLTGGVLVFKDVIGGSNITVASTQTTLTISSQATQQAAVYGVSYGLGTAYNAGTNLYLQFNSSQSTTNPHAAFLINKPTTLMGLSVALNNHFTPITIGAADTTIFTLGYVAAGDANSSANFTPFAGGPQITWDDTLDQTWPVSHATNLNLAAAVGDRVYVQVQGGANVNGLVYGLDWSLWYANP